MKLGKFWSRSTENIGIKLSLSQHYDPWLIPSLLLWNTALVNTKDDIRSHLLDRWFAFFEMKSISHAINSSDIYTMPFICIYLYWLFLLADSLSDIVNQFGNCALGKCPLARGINISSTGWLYVDLSSDKAMCLGNLGTRRWLSNKIRRKYGIYLVISLHENF